MADPADTSLGGIPGGKLTLSANGTKDAIIWATAPVDGDANKQVVAGVVCAFDAGNFDPAQKNPAEAGIPK